MRHRDVLPDSQRSGLRGARILRARASRTSRYGTARCDSGLGASRSATSIRRWAPERMDSRSYSSFWRRCYRPHGWRGARAGDLEEARRGARRPPSTPRAAVSPRRASRSRSRRPPDDRPPPAVEPRHPVQIAGQTDRSEAGSAIFWSSNSLLGVRSMTSPPASALLNGCPEKPGALYCVQAPHRSRSM